MSCRSPPHPFPRQSVFPRYLNVFRHFFYLLRSLTHPTRVSPLPVCALRENRFGQRSRFQAPWNVGVETTAASAAPRARWELIQDKASDAAAAPRPNPRYMMHMGDNASNGRSCCEHALVNPAGVATSHGHTAHTTELHRASRGFASLPLKPSAVMQGRALIIVLVVPGALPFITEHDGQSVCKGDDCGGINCWELSTVCVSVCVWV